MVAELIAKENWSFALYKQDDRFILSVVCGGVGLYELNIPVSSEDVRKGLADNDYLRRIADRVRTYPKEYEAMSLPFEK